MNKEDFPSFFAAVNGGHAPFHWQQRLFDHVIRAGKWPNQIVAPTGAGKTSVVEIHIFLAALYAAGVIPAVGRRLSIVVNRRGLVDSHYERARRIRDLLHGALTSEEDGILKRVALSLRSLTAQVPDGFPEKTQVTAEDLLVCVDLRGGISPQREWIDDPRACAVIAATPDMWGSRLLFRSYAGSQKARAREAGLLALDSVMVLDEAHLNRQLLHTARSVAQLTAKEAAVIGVPPLAVIEITATPHKHIVIDEDLSNTTVHSPQVPSFTSVGVEKEDLEGQNTDIALIPRLTSPKQVRVVRSANWTGAPKPSAKYVNELASLARELRNQQPSSDAPRTVGCVVNHVETAVRLAQELRRTTLKTNDADVSETTSRATQVDSDEDMRVVAWVGRMRPVDLERYREVLTTGGDDRIEFLVATQTIEVGVDLDLAGMVTELAPGSALVQRAGRVNRFGKRPEARIVVVCPEGDIVKDRPPYRQPDLVAAQQWIDRLTTDSVGLSPWNLTHPDKIPPSEALRRLAFTSVYPHDAVVLAETSENLFAEVDLSFWLRDDLEADVDPVGIVRRGPLPLDDGVALALLKATPPESREVYPTLLHTAREVLSKIFESKERARAFRWSKDELTLMTAGDQLRPGDQIIIDARHPITLENVVVDTAPATAALPITYWGNDRTVVIQADREHQDEHSELLSLIDDVQFAAEVVKNYSESLGDNTPFPDDAQVILPPDELWATAIPSCEPPWVVIRSQQDTDADPELRQEWTRAAEPPLLADHAAAVGKMGHILADDIKLSPPLAEVIYEAGLHHDDGKDESRFQIALDTPSGGASRAKSAERSAQQSQRSKRRSGLPSRWRHEQFSVVHTYLALPDSDIRDIVARLVGTSHGYGRSIFPHGEDGLLGKGATAEQRAVAKQLFGNGTGWSNIIEKTHATYGIWGCAYLEAVLRAADCRVSREGK